MKYVGQKQHHRVPLEPYRAVPQYESRGTGSPTHGLHIYFILFCLVCFVLFYYALYIMAYGLVCDYVCCVVSEVFKPVKKTLRLLF
jgi:hypothetical protein